MGIEQFLFVAARRQEWTPERSPQVARTDLRGESTDLHRAARTSAGEILALGHQWCPSPTRLIMVAAKAAPKPLSILTTVTPLAQLLSIPSSAAMPPNEAP